MGQWEYQIPEKCFIKCQPTISSIYIHIFLSFKFDFSLAFWVYVTALRRGNQKISIGAFEKNFSEEFLNIHSKSTAPESLFNKIPDQQPPPSLEEILQHACFALNLAKFFGTVLLEVTTGCETVGKRLHVFSVFWFHLSLPYHLVC